MAIVCDDVVVAARLDHGHDTGGGVLMAAGMTQALGEEGAGGVGQHAEQLPVLLEDPADTQGHREDPMPVPHVEDDLLERPAGKQQQHLEAAGRIPT